MFEPEEDSPRRYQPKPKLSKTPSWVMLGFVIGVLFMLALRSREEKEPTRPTSPPPALVAPPAPELTTIEAAFEYWRSYAAWHEDVTEVALWSASEHGYTDFYQVRRVDDVLFYRSLTRLSRVLVIDDSRLPPECPLRFTIPFGQPENQNSQRAVRPQWPVDRPVAPVLKPDSTPVPSIVPPRPEMEPIPPASAP